MASTNLRRAVSGTFDWDELQRLKLPVAWSGTVPAEERREQEEDRHALAREAIEALDQCPDGIAVEIEDGEIVGVVTSEEDAE